MDVKTKIMVVEDLNITALDIKNRLRRLGYEVPAVVATGEQAIQEAEETGPDLILMDIKLKGDMDGIEAAIRIRSRLDIPIVYLTANTDETTLQRAKATGPRGFVQKPFQEKELQDAILIALEGHESEKAELVPG